MGIPPSDVRVLVLENKTQVHNFAVEFSSYLNGIRWMASNWFLALMRPFLGKASNEMMHSFIKPTFDLYVDSMNKGNNWINYDAPQPSPVLHAKRMEFPPALGGDKVAGLSAKGITATPAEVGEIPLGV